MGSSTGNPVWLAAALAAVVSIAWLSLLYHRRMTSSILRIFDAGFLDGLNELSEEFTEEAAIALRDRLRELAIVLKRDYPASDLSTLTSRMLLACVDNLRNVVGGEAPGVLSPADYGRLRVATMSLASALTKSDEAAVFEANGSLIMETLAAQSRRYDPSLSQPQRPPNDRERSETTLRFVSDLKLVSAEFRNLNSVPAAMIMKKYGWDHDAVTFRIPEIAVFSTWYDLSKRRIATSRLHIHRRWAVSRYFNALAKDVDAYGDGVINADPFKQYRAIVRLSLTRSPVEYSSVEG